MENLEKKFKRIRDKHPKVKLKPINKVYETLKEATINNPRLYLRARDIIISGMNEREIKRCLSYLEESKYVDVFRNGNPFVYFSSEKPDGAFEFIERPLITQTKNEHFSKVIDFYLNRHSELLDEELLREIEKVQASKNTKHPNWVAYNILVQELWDNGFSDFIKLSFRKSAKRYKI